MSCTECPGSQAWKCQNATQCISESMLCDGKKDCENGSDEQECPICRKDEVKCLDRSKCIPKRWLFDRFEDCDDGLDEKSCQFYQYSGLGNCTICQGGKYSRKCPNEQKCIRTSWICDGIEDCSNGEDEHKDCLKCTNGWCDCKDGKYDIPQSWLCDGSNDCSDGSDEKQCDL